MYSFFVLNGHGIFLFKIILIFGYFLIHQIKLLYLILVDQIVRFICSLFDSRSIYSLSAGLAREMIQK